MSASIRGPIRLGVLAMTAGIATGLLVVATSGCRAQDAEDRGFVVAAAQAELRFWASAEEFAEDMAGHVEAAVARGADLIALPEHIGLPLVILGDLDVLAQSESVEQAIEGLVKRHAAQIGPLMAEHEISPQRALLVLKDPVMRAAYEQTFSALAREHQVYICAGSMPMVLPDRQGDVFNTACVFDPTGTMHIVGTKVNLVHVELPDGIDLSPGSIDDYRVIRTPRAVIGTIICADGWDDEIAERLIGLGAQILVQVSANPQVWDEDRRADWKEATVERAQEHGIYGVSVTGVGNLLGMPVQGRSALVAPREWTEDGSGYIAEAVTATDEELLVTTLDLSRVDRKQD